MKRFYILLSMLLLTVCAVTAQVLHVNQVGQTQQSLELNQLQTLKFTDQALVFTMADGTTLTFPIADVQTLTFGEGGSSEDVGIEKVAGEKFAITLSDGRLMVNHPDAAVRVVVYAMDGRVVQQAELANGEAMTLGALSKGFYVVKVGAEAAIFQIR